MIEKNHVKRLPGSLIVKLLNRSSSYRTIVHQDVARTQPATGSDTHQRVYTLRLSEIPDLVFLWEADVEKGSGNICNMAKHIEGCSLLSQRTSSKIVRLATNEISLPPFLPILLDWFYTILHVHNNGSVFRISEAATVRKDCNWMSVVITSRSLYVRHET